MSDNTGFISIHRALQSHWIWQDANKLKWWLDILLTVNHTPCDVIIGNEIFTCERGQSLLSILSWAERWKVSKDTARNFLKLLEKQHMVECVSIGKSTRLTVCKYDDYQTRLHVKQTHSVRTLATNNNDNNENKNNNIVGLHPTHSTISGSVEERCRKFVAYFNETKESNFKVTEKVKKAFARAIKDYTAVDLMSVVNGALSDKHHRESNFMYVTPEFVLRTDIIERYKNFVMPKKPTGTGR